MKRINYVIVVVSPNQEKGYVQRISAKGNMTVTKDKTKAKSYKNEDYVMYDLDRLAEYVLQGYNFSYDVR